MEIPMKVAVPNAFSTRIVPIRVHAYKPSVKILVRERVDKMPVVMLTIICLRVHATKVTPVILTVSVIPYNKVR